MTRPATDSPGDRCPPPARRDRAVMVPGICLHGLFDSPQAVPALMQDPIRRGGAANQEEPWTQP